MIYKKSVALLAVVAFMCTPLMSLSVAHAQESGLGISPSRITADHLLRGVPYEQTFVLSHGSHSEAKFLRVVADGSIQDWVTTDRGMEFTWPHSADGGDTQFPLTVIVTPPEDAANGNYTGTIRIINTSGPSEAADGNGASISLAVAIEANLTISDEQVLDYELHTIAAPHQVEEGAPLELAVHIENRGNVRAQPGKVEVDYYDQFNETLLEQEAVTAVGFVPAFARDGVIAVEVPHGLAVGQYWARILIFDDAGELLKEEDKIFEVVPAGSLEKQGVLKALEHEAVIEPGSVLKITGVFENTGSSNVTAALAVEVYEGDALVEVLESDVRSVAIGATEELVVFFTPESAGEYRLAGTVSYSGKDTPVVESTVQVGAKQAMGMMIVGIIVIIIIVLAALAFFIWKKRTHHEPDDSLTIEQNPENQEFER